MKVRGDDHAEPSAGLQINVRINTALADELQFRQTLEKGSADFGSLPDQHQRFRVLEPFGECVDLLDVISPDLHLMTSKLSEAFERPKRVVVIVQDRNLHEVRSTSLGRVAMKRLQSVVLLIVSSLVWAKSATVEITPL